MSDSAARSRLEKCELTWKQNRLERFKADFPHLDPMIAEQIFQWGYQSGYGRAWRRIGKADQDRDRFARVATREIT